MSPPDPLRASRALAWLALALPPLVALLIGAQGTWLRHTDAAGAAPRLAARVGLAQVCLTPAGQPPRLGPGSHPAVDARPGPGLPLQAMPPGVPAGSR